jgi:CO/xanthine dehydrogenase Mo-binding subunit
MLAIDPIEFRRRNVVGPNDNLDSAWAEATDLTIGSYGLDQCIDAVERALANNGAPPKPSGEHWLEGSGMAISMLDCAPPTEQRSGAEIELRADGTYHFTVGSTEIGNGLVTAQQQVVAQIMGCSTSRVSFLNADTDKTPYDSGTFASVGMMVPTKAVESAALALREKILGYASRATGERLERCRLEGDAVVCGERTTALTELYERGKKEGFQFDAFRKAYGSPRTVAFMAYGVRLAVHRITGEIVILYSVEAVDAGVVMNPHQLRGQVVGGVVMGIGAALQEKMVYDDRGAVVNPTLRNYRIPAIADAPPTDVLFADTYDAIGPLGAKSIAENTNNPVPPAIGNALRAATGARFTTLPFTEDRIFARLAETAAS